MRLSLSAIVCASVILSGCANLEAEHKCEYQAGPKPYPAAEAFGIVGVLIVSQSDDRQAWYNSVDNCMDAWRAKRDAANLEASKLEAGHPN